MDSATTPTQLAAHRVFVYHEPDNRTEYVSPDAVSLADARTEIARYDWNRRARVHLTPDPSGTYIAGPAPQVADLIAHLMDGPPAALGAAYGVLHVVAGLPDRWVSDVERCDRQRAAVNAALREGSERT